MSELGLDTGSNLQRSPHAHRRNFQCISNRPARTWGVIDLDGHWFQSTSKAWMRDEKRNGWMEVTHFAPWISVRLVRKLGRHVVTHGVPQRVQDALPCRLQGMKPFDEKEHKLPSHWYDRLATWSARLGTFHTDVMENAHGCCEVFAWPDAHDAWAQVLRTHYFAVFFLSLFTPGYKLVR